MRSVLPCVDLRTKNAWRSGLCLCLYFIDGQSRFVERQRKNSESIFIDCQWSMLRSSWGYRAFVQKSLRFSVKKMRFGTDISIPRVGAGPERCQSCWSLCSTTQLNKKIRGSHGEQDGERLKSFYQKLFIWSAWFTETQVTRKCVVFVQWLFRAPTVHVSEARDQHWIIQGQTARYSSSDPTSSKALL